MLYISYNYYTSRWPLPFPFGVLSENEGLDLTCCCLAGRCVAVAALGRRVPSSRLLNTVEFARLKLHLTSRPGGARAITLAL